MKKTMKKLVLRVESIKVISGRQLGGVVGGSTYGGSAATIYDCPTAMCRWY